MLIRVLKYGTLTLMGGGTAFALHQNDWNVSTFGIVRFGRTALTVTRIVADYKISTRGLKSMTEEEINACWSEVHSRSADKLLNLCCTNGGVFIKVGQHIGALDYVVPPEYTTTLKVLHSKAPKSTLDQVHRVIQEDLGKPVAELFSSFEETPRGTASLAQVHKAVLKETGETVAVKVQHPRVKKHSLVDMATMDLLVRMVDQIFPDFSFLWLADEMKRNLPLELDFYHEGKNSEKVKKLFSHLKWLNVPAVNWELSTTRVLTMEFLDGGEVTDKQYVKDHNLNPRVISDRISTLYSEMIFMQGYVHCDPHPGNILVKNGGRDGPQIMLLDHGLYTELPEKFRSSYSNLWISIIQGDQVGMKVHAQALGAGDLFPLLSCMLASKPWESIVAGLTSNKPKKSAKEEKEQLRKYAVEYFPQITAILARVNREMLLVLKTNDLLRGIEASLGTRGEKQSLIKMSKYCVQSVYEERRKGTGVLGGLVVSFSKNIALARINLYAWYLWACTKVYGSAYM